MKKLLLTAALLVSVGLTGGAQQLHFDKNGRFKIVQLTDTHLRTTLKSDVAAVYSLMEQVIKAEKPDLVVLTGDNVTVNPAKPEIRKLVKFLDARKVPWCAVFGNHDDQQELSRSEMSALYASGKYSLNTLNADGELADVELSVLSKDGKGAFYVYCMDSHAYSTVLGEECYDWFTAGQVQWLRDCCTARTETDGSVAPALAFFHIPLREYIDAWCGRENPREDVGGGYPSVGIRGESICCGALNSGMFTAMRETRSVIGVSVGHDHDNDFVAAYNGIALCYGRFSGAGSVYNHLPQGARVFEIREGEQGFETWIREASGRIVRHTFFDGKTLKNAPRDRKKTYGSWSEIER